MAAARQAGCAESDLGRSRLGIVIADKPNITY